MPTFQRTSDDHFTIVVILRGDRLKAPACDIPGKIIEMIIIVQFNDHQSYFRNKMTVCKNLLLTPFNIHFKQVDASYAVMFHNLFDCKCGHLDPVAVFMDEIAPCRLMGCNTHMVAWTPNKCTMHRHNARYCCGVALE